MAARLTRSLPLALEAEVSSLIADWDAHRRVGRIRARDIASWTGGDVSLRRDRLGAAADQSTDDDCFTALQDDLRPHRFEDAVLLGTGALSVFAEVLSLMFPSTDADLPRLRVLDSTDPQQLAALEHELALDRTLFFVSSRSGMTLEPDVLASYFFARLAGLLGVEEAGRRFIAITDTGSPLQVLAERRGYRQIFHGLATVGGCSSALSDFGMLPATACGIDVTTLLDRGERMADACAECVPGVDNPGLVLGAIIGACTTHGRDKLTLITSPGLQPVGAWLEQLLAGSTTKDGKGVIPVDREPLGAPDAYGEDRLFVCLRLAGEDDQDQDVGVQALQDGGQPVVRIELADRFDVGAEIVRWEFATAVACALLGVDPCAQPDVEDAEVAAHGLLDAYDRSQTLPDLTPFYEGDGVRLFADERNAAELHDDVGGPHGFAEYLAAHLSLVEAGDYVALLAYLPMNDEHERRLTEMRVLIRDHLRVATCVGFGPRFQHSTGQSYKGGPNTGVFLQLTGGDSVARAVPGHTYGLGIVNAAQARADFDALASRGRRALRIDIGEDVTAGLVALRHTVRQVLRYTTSNHAEKWNR